MNNLKDKAIFSTVTTIDKDDANQHVYQGYSINPNEPRGFVSDEEVDQYRAELVKEFDAIQ